MGKFNWQNGSQVEPAKVEIEGVSYNVVEAQYEGETPISAGNLNAMQDDIFDWIYPVGSYYETSDTTFNPNISWRGTWVEDTSGRVTVAQDSEDTDFDTVGSTGGSKFLQEHSHSSSKPALAQAKAGSGGNYGFVSNGAWNATETAGTGNSGNLQPYTVVKRWHRTA